MSSPSDDLFGEEWASTAREAWTGQGKEWEVAGGGLALAGWLLVAGPVVGMVPVGHPALVPVWSMPRHRFVATVEEHRTAWAWLNAGFALATIATTAGLVAFALTLPDRSAAAAVLAGTVGYGIGGALWCAVLAIRTRTIPLLAGLGAEALSSREVALLDAATTGLYQAFVDHWLRPGRARHHPAADRGGTSGRGRHPPDLRRRDDRLAPGHR